MSGHKIAYHLRTNKYVERKMFLDVLSRVRIWSDSSNYFYASLGGQFLEDFKHVNSHLGIDKMCSLETDESTWKRQKFNLPFGFLNCTDDSTGEFVKNFDAKVGNYRDCKFIVWLDYANANERHRQLQEFSELVSKMGPGDVAKITLNANHASKARRSDFSTRKHHEGFLLNELSNDLGEFTPSGGILSKYLSPEPYAKFLADAVRIAAVKGCESATDIQAKPLQVCRYKDGEHQMLTVSLIIANDNISKALEADTVFKQSGIRSFVWDQIHYVSVPDLSWRERTYINSKIGDESVSDIHDSFGFLFADNREDSLALIKSYVNHYRRYPGFTPMPSI